VDFALTEEQQELKSAARAWLSERYPLDRDFDAPQDDRWAELAELGWLGVSVSEDEGGVGLGFLEEALILEEMGYALYPGPYLATVGFALATLGPEERAEVAAGTKTWSTEINGLVPWLGSVDRVVGLELGADDYVVKPFGLRELIARIRAVTRRTSSRPQAQEPLRVGTLTVDERARRAQLGDRELELTPKEFDLLAALARDPGAAVSRRRLLEEVWETAWYGSAKTIDVHVASLRRKLGDPGWIETVRGVGFRLRAA